MSQGPLQANVSLTGTSRTALTQNAQGGLHTDNGATLSSLNITANTVVKATPGRAVMVTVVVAGSVAGSVNDAATVGTAATANQIFTTPTTVGTTWIDWPCANGIVVNPGTGQTIAVAYV